MFHAPSILTESVSHDKDLVIQKFTTLINNIVQQFKAYDIDSLIIEAAKADISEDEKIDLIEKTIRGHCKFLDVPIHLCTGELENYTPKALASLTVNEQLYLLSHIDLFALRADVELPNPMFANLVYGTVRKLILKTAV